MPWSTITCPECGAENLDTALVCVRCNARLEDAERTEEVALPKQLESGERKDDERDETGEGTSLRSDFLLEGAIDRSAGQRREQAAEGPFSGRPRSTGGAGPSQGTTRQAASQPRTESDELSLDPNEIEAITHYGKGRRIISVIGFSGSGKTFLVNRLRELTMSRGAWKAYPPPAEEITVSAAGIELTHLVAARNGWTRRQRGYVVMDCAGESFKLAFERIRSDRELQSRIGHPYLAALGLASAYLLVLRVQDLVPGLAETPKDKDSQRETTDLANRFYDIVGAILLARERVRRDGAELLLAQGISRDELAEAFQRRNRCPAPLCVVLAQADQVEGKLGPNTGFDHDPYRFARYHAGKLFHAVHNSFAHYRFEFVSGFYDYKKDDPLKPHPTYELPSYGVADVFDWIDRLVAPRPPLIGPMLRVAEGGVPTSWAVRLRRWLDRDFRKAGA